MHTTEPQIISKRNQTFFGNLLPDRFINKSSNSVSNPFVRYRREKQFRLMLEHLNPEFKDLILCVGVGSGREIDLLNNYVEKVYGVDISERFMNHCADRFGDRFEGCLCDLETEKTIYSKGFFDKVVCINVLPYFTLTGINNFFREMSRVIRRNGQLFIFVLNAEFPFSGLLQEQLLKNRLNDSRAIYFYRPLSDYVNTFSKYGFKMSKVQGGDFFCDINSHFFNYLFNLRWSGPLIRLMEFGGETALKRYYRSLNLTLIKQ